MYGGKLPTSEVEFSWRYLGRLIGGEGGLPVFSKCKLTYKLQNSSNGTGCVKAFPGALGGKETIAGEDGGEICYLFPVGVHICSVGRTKPQSLDLYHHYVSHFSLSNIYKRVKKKMVVC